MAPVGPCRQSALLRPRVSLSASVNIPAAWDVEAVHGVSIVYNVSKLGQPSLAVDQLS